MKRRFILILAGAAVVSLFAAAVWPRPREPVYQDKRLSEWLELYNPRALRSSGEISPAAAAIREMGTNATPWLLRWIGYESPRWKKSAEIALARSLSSRSQFLLEQLSRKDRQAWKAVCGFEILGRQAVDALPELTRLSHATNAPDSALRAQFCLQYVAGP